MSLAFMSQGLHVPIEDVATQSLAITDRDTIKHGQHQALKVNLLFQCIHT